jgi:predicted aspartyl protease
MQRLYTAIAILLSPCAWAGTDAIDPPLPTTPNVLDTPIAPIIVEAPEPRYVAPTLRDRIGRIWAPVLINGKGPYRLVLDTGANSAALIPSVAHSLGLPINGSRKVQLHGVTGSAVVPIVTLNTMEVGDLLIEDSHVPIVADVFGGAEGVIGAKGLTDKRIYIDFRNDHIRIEHSKNQPAPIGYSRVPLTLTRGQLLTMDIRIGSIRTKAIIDTGAQQTIGNHSLREALLKREREGIETNVIGVTLDVAQGKSIAVPPINLGDVQIRNMRVTFGDMFIFDQWKLSKEPAMLVGMDVIGTLDSLIIDYRRREALLRTRR